MDHGFPGRCLQRSGSDRCACVGQRLGARRPGAAAPAGAWGRGPGSAATRRPCFGPDPRAEAVGEKFVLAVGHKFEQVPAVAPLLCAGITMWSPLTYWNTGPG